MEEPQDTNKASKDRELGYMWMDFYSILYRMGDDVGACPNGYLFEPGLPSEPPWFGQLNWGPVASSATMQLCYEKVLPKLIANVMLGEKSSQILLEIVRKERH
eukprot:jgi/Botrbrau1/16138/Bobra.7_2s0096.1